MDYKIKENPALIVEYPANHVQVGSFIINLKIYYVHNIKIIKGMSSKHIRDPFIANECPPLSQTLGRCGSLWGGRCNKNLVDYAVFCNEENGWCGVSSDHKYAQISDIYDWEPKSCRRNDN